MTTRYRSGVVSATTTMSEPKALNILFEFLHSVGMLKNLMLFQEAVEFISRFKAEQKPGLISRKRTGTKAFNHKSFQNFARLFRVALQLFRDVDGHLHGSIIA